MRRGKWSRSTQVSTFTAAAYRQNANMGLQVHCMALIKNALMCQADTTLLTMRWLDFSPIPAANWSTPRTCVDWSRIDDWTKNNWVDAKKDGRMVHPKFGMF